MQHFGQAMEIINTTKKEFAPDGRVAKFGIGLSKKGNELILTGETNLPEAKTALLERLQAVDFPIIDSIQSLPHPNLEGKHYGVVRLSVCNIRSNPKHSAELSTQALLGTPLRVYKEDEKNPGWYLIQTPDDYFGWLDKDGFTLMDKGAYDNWMGKEKVMVTLMGAKIHEAHDANSPSISDAVAGDILSMEQDMGGVFIKVGFPDGRMGYLGKRYRVKMEYLLKRDSMISANGLIYDAKDFLGHPYLWGGTSEKGMDCSGFTKTVFFRNGIQLPRDASQQVHVGIEVPTDIATLENLMPGDLLFFGRKATEDQKEKIWHVAIYMGDGKMIHSAGNVKVESLRKGEPDFAEDRFNTFVRAKRILTSLGENGVVMLRDSEFY